MYTCIYIYMYIHILIVEQGAKSNVAYNFKRLAESAKQAEALTSELTTVHVQLQVCTYMYMCVLQKCKERQGLYRGTYLASLNILLFIHIPVFIYIFI
jgi:hypothetical protein